MLMIEIFNEMCILNWIVQNCITVVGKRLEILLMQLEDNLIM